MRLSNPLKLALFGLATLLAGCMGGGDEGDPTPQNQNTAPWAYAGADTAVGVGETVSLRGRGGREGGRIVEWAWDIGATGDFKAVASGDTAVKSPGEPGMVQHVLRVTADDGRIARDTLRVTTVRPAPPIAFAGNDTSVTIRDTVLLQGKATLAFGRIAKWEWDVGNTGVFRAIASGDTAVIAQDSVGYQHHVLRVTDNVGRSALDTLRVTVRDDRPTVTISTSLRKLAEGGGYALSAKATDRGRIVKWEWDLGDSVFRAASGPDTGIRPSGFAGNAVRVRVRVTDDDGHPAEAVEELPLTHWDYLVNLPVEFEAPEVHRAGAKMASLGGKLYVLARKNQFYPPHSIFASYDPATGKWKTLSLHPKLESYDFTLAVLDGKLLTFAPWSQPGLSEIFEYDPRLDEWAALKDASTSCVRCAAVPLDSGLYLVGGQNGIVGKYRPVSGEVEQQPSELPSDYNMVDAVSLEGGLYGIVEARSRTLFYSWTLEGRRWTGRPGLPELMERPALVAAAGYIYALGGSNKRWVFRYGPAIGWTRLRDMVFGARSQAAVVAGGKIYTLWDNSIQVYDPAAEL